MKASERQLREEKEFLERLKAHPDDNTLWEALYGRKSERWERLVKMAATYVDSEAEGQEIVQEALIQARRDLPRITHTLQGWLYRLVQRRALDRVRRNKEQVRDLRAPKPFDAADKPYVDWEADDPHRVEDGAYQSEKDNPDVEREQSGPRNEKERNADIWWELYIRYRDVLDPIECRVARFFWERDLRREEVATMCDLSLPQVKVALDRIQRKLERANDAVRDVDHAWKKTGDGPGL